MRVAVTGATGFVGGRLTVLLRRGGLEVVPIRRRVPPPEARTGAVEVPHIADEEALVRAFSGADAVVHLAARVHVMKERVEDPLGAFRSVNVEGTAAVCRAALRTGVRHLIALSTIKADERFAPYSSDPYGRSKAEAEARIADTLQDRVHWTVLRPPLVYGPGVGGNFRRLLKLASLATWLPLPLGSIGNSRSLIFCDNLCDAVLHNLLDPRASGLTVPVCDGPALSTDELVVHLAEGMGGRARLVALPSGLAPSVLGVLGMGAQADRLWGSLVIDPEIARADLGWSAPISIRDGLQETARWWIGECGAEKGRRGRNSGRAGGG